MGIQVILTLSYGPAGKMPANLSGNCLSNSGPSGVIAFGKRYLCLDFGARVEKKELSNPCIRGKISPISPAIIEEAPQAKRRSRPSE